MKLRNLIEEIKRMGFNEDDDILNLSFNSQMADGRKDALTVHISAPLKKEE
jgi:hypothetical protein